MKKESLTVAVLMGGPSAEAEVSRSSAREVAAALQLRGHRVHTLELDAALTGELLQRQPDVVFPALHGPPGEDGTVQGYLEMLGLPYVGSGVHGSATAMDKQLSKLVYREAGLPVARDLVFHQGTDVGQAAARVVAELGTAVVIKPLRQGSALGVTRVTGADGLAAAVQTGLGYGGGILVEPFVTGREITVGVLDLWGEDPVALPVIEIRTAAGQWYDFTNRYQVGASEHIIPAPLPAPLNARLQDIAQQAHTVLGLRDLSRSDFIVTDEGEIYLLETNTLPGMTPTSLYPDAARALGIGFDVLMHRLVHSARNRHRQAASSSSASAA